MDSFVTSFIFAFLVIVSSSDFQLLFINGESFANRWAIDGNPESLIENNTYYMTFDVHESITADNIVGKFQESSCDQNGTELVPGDGTSGILEVGSNITAFGKGTFYFHYDIPTFRNNSNIFQVDQLGLKAGFHLCVAYILQTADGTNTLVNQRDIDVTISLEMEAGLSLEIPDPGEAVGEGEDPIRGVYSFEDGWGVAAYLCDLSSPSVPLQDVTYSQGSLISVCITPSADSLSRGLLMEKINWFVWNRGFVEQPAVEDGLAASNSLTHFDCSPGSLYCTVSSILFADFYATRRNLQVAIRMYPESGPNESAQIKRELSASSVAEGSGQATMMFVGNGRHLDTSSGRRALESESETSYLELLVNIRTVDDEHHLIGDDDSLIESAASSSMRTWALITSIFFLGSTANI